jgi:endogenous inhibitor of DNA gyrase (YacG/DUF329 family)
MNKSKTELMSEKSGARCPECTHSSDARKAAHFPFCSKRCALVDLSRWLNEEYAFPQGTPALRLPLKGEEQ